MYKETKPESIKIDDELITLGRQIAAIILYRMEVSTNRYAIKLTGDVFPNFDALLKLDRSDIKEIEQTLFVE